MKASKFSATTKAFIFKPEADEICRRAGISQATYFNWKKKHDGLLPTEMKRLKQRERQAQEACRRPSLDKEMLQDVIRRDVSIRRGLLHRGVRHVVLPLQVPPPRPGRHRGSDQGHLRDTRSLR